MNNRNSIGAVLLPFVLLSMGCSGSPWTSRVCASNGSGNCLGIDNVQPHHYTVKSSLLNVKGIADVPLNEPACASNGIGEVDVQVINRDTLDVTIYCLVDHSDGGTMTLPDAGAAPDAVNPNGGN